MDYVSALRLVFHAQMVDWLFCSFNSDYSQQKLSAPKASEKVSAGAIGHARLTLAEPAGADGHAE